MKLIMLLVESFDIFTLADWVGMSAFAISGMLVAIRKKLDVVGVFICGMLTASGGGTIRDVLVGRIPSVLQDNAVFYLVCVLLLSLFLFKLYKHTNLEEKTWFVVSDALGLSAFGITGLLIGIEYELHFFGAVALSFITAKGGGIIRDILLNKVPDVLQTGFYGSVTLIQSSILYGFYTIGHLHDVVIIIMFFAAFALRVVAHYKKWKMPTLFDVS